MEKLGDGAERLRVFWEGSEFALEPAFPYL